ncbi:hypothetical protein ACTVCO_04925 [Sanguibacter sp. A247]|uniref:hypothetical protein n=1 Tax=unclassified Sanguibacter TaxID=2645534 RepID=UPI003FD71695
MNRLQTRTRRGAAAALSLAVVAGLAACSPLTTDLPYAASDGIRVDVAPGVIVQNLLVIAADKGAPGAIQAGLVNNSATDITVAIGVERFDVAAGTTTVVGGPSGTPSLITSVSVAPGAVLPLAVGTPESATEVPVPVLDATHPEYAALVPTEGTEGTEG